MGPENNRESLQGIGQFAQTTAATILRKERTVDGVCKLIRKIDLFADREVAGLDRLEPVECGPGCDHCCYRSLSVTVPEAIAAGNYVEEHFSAEQRSALLGRIDHFVAATAPFRGGREAEAREACPLLVDRLCSIYPVRPLVCRAANSKDACSCEQWKLNPDNPPNIPERTDQRPILGVLRAGMRSGMRNANLSSDGGDFASLLKDVLLSGDCGAGYLKGEAINNGVKASETVKEDPTGLFTQPPPDVLQFYRSKSVDGDLEAALPNLTGNDTMRKLLRFAVPSAYRSTDEIEEWRARAATTLEELRDSALDPIEGFTAMYMLDTFAFAYQATDVKPLMSSLGDLLCEKIVRPLFPDLSEPIAARKDGGKLKVGYLSNNLRHNNGSYWALGWLEAHGEEIETYAFNVSPIQDEVTKEWARLADHYHHLPGSVPQAARLIKSLGLDVLIFTDIGMSGHNLQYASLRMAPVQCTAWGHPVTSGLPTIDDYLSSDLMEPANADAHYREKLVRLPNSGLRFRRASLPPKPKQKREVGLPDGFLPFMGQNLMKCHPRWDDLFRSLNEAIQGPIVFVASTKRRVSEITAERLKKAGVRCIWVPQQRSEDYLRMMGACDVSIDPPDWSGGNTTVQALSMGVPVVTLPGAFMRGRHSLAFNQLANVPELIASNPQEYVEKASNADFLRSTMEKVRPANLYEDHAPVEALDKFLWMAARGVQR